MPFADTLYMPERPIDPPEQHWLSQRDENAIEHATEEKLRAEFESGDEDALQHCRDYVSDNQGEIVNLLIALDDGKEDATIQLLRLVRDWKADSVELRKYGMHAEELRAQIEREEL